MKQIPSADLFVVRLSANGKNAASNRLASLGEVEKLKGSEALLLRLADRAADPKAAWRQIREALGSGATIQPVLLDEQGEPHYPTGEISVRFHQAPSDQQLEKFAARHGLRLRDRNEFVPQQAVFQPSEPSQTYLPDLVQELASVEDTREVWANTLSQYRRI